MFFFIDRSTHTDAARRSGGTASVGPEDGASVGASVVGAAVGACDAATKLVRHRTCGSARLPPHYIGARYQACFDGAPGAPHALHCMLRSNIARPPLCASTDVAPLVGVSVGNIVGSCVGEPVGTSVGNLHHAPDGCPRADVGVSPVAMRLWEGWAPSRRRDVGRPMQMGAGGYAVGAPVVGATVGEPLDTVGENDGAAVGAAVVGCAHRQTHVRTHTRTHRQVYKHRL
jgi:hypothetical protein